jgi:cell division septation protein DedD
VAPSPEEGIGLRMKDKQKSEEELFDELDSMYQRVADLERNETATEPESHPNEYKQVTDQAVPTHEQVVSFSEDIIRATPENLLKKIPKPNKKRSYRLVIVATTFSLIVLVFFAIIILKTVINPQSSKKGIIYQPTVTVPFATKKYPPESPPVQMEQEAMKNTQEGGEAAGSISQGIMKPDKSLAPNRYWAIQIGAFHNLEYLHDLIEDLKKEGLDAYWISRGSDKRKPLYIVFVGRFMDTHEAAEFLKDKKILTHYPDSFVQEILSSEINH